LGSFAHKPLELLSLLWRPLKLGFLAFKYIGEEELSTGEPWSLEFCIKV
jgi:hypothetical protein